MKILSRMLTKKPQPEEAPAQMDLEENERPQSRPMADDSGRVNPSRPRSGAQEPPLAVTSRPIRSKSDLLESPGEPEPEVVAESWEDSDWDDDWDDDEDWGDEDLDMGDPARALKASQDKEHLVSEIRDAMESAPRPTSQAQPKVTPAEEDGFYNRWAEVEEDDDSARQAMARNELHGSASEDGIFEKTETAMTDRETSRRRSAMAHLKAAAAATKADRVLKHAVSRDPNSDAEDQSPYRDDLAKVVRPQRSTSRPISRVVTQQDAPRAIWDQGEGDEDAALFAASTGDEAQDASIEAELAAAEEERLARAPLDLSEEDFADDSVFERVPDEEEEIEAAPSDDDFPNSPFSASRIRSEPVEVSSFDAPKEELNAFDPAADFGDEESYDEDYEDEDEDFAPRPSSAVSEAVAFANATDDDEEPTPDEGEVRKKIWEMADEVATEVERAREEPAAPIMDAAPVVAGRAGRSAGRVKTRMLGFQPDTAGPKDVFEETAEKAAVAGAVHFPAGWIVVVEGPGRGASFTLQNGVSQIGRGEDQAVRLDFGDTSISRNNHAAVAYDDEQGKFFLGHGGKSNLVRLNGRPVLSTEEMSDGDQIRIGETTLKFVALCGEDFTWKSTEGDNGANA